MKRKRCMVALLGLVNLIFCLCSAEAVWKVMRSTAWQTHFRALHFVDAQNGWIVGDNGVIAHTSDGGATFLPQKSGTSDSLSSVSFVNPKEGWAVGENGTIIHTKDGGENWETQVSGTKISLKSVQFINSRQGWAVGGGHDRDSRPFSVLLHTDDGGATWNDYSQKLPKSEWGYDLEKVHFINALEGWLTGGWWIEGNIFHTQDGGATWEAQQTEEDVIYSLHDIYFINPKEGWAVGGGGGVAHWEVIRHTSDGGTTWTAQGVSLTEESVDEGTDSTEQFVEYWLKGVHFVTENDGWAVGEDGQIIHTSNGGYSF